MKTGENERRSWRGRGFIGGKDKTIRRHDLHQGHLELLKRRREAARHNAKTQKSHRTTNKKPPQKKKPHTKKKTLPERMRGRCQQQESKTVKGPDPGAAIDVIKRECLGQKGGESPSIKKFTERKRTPQILQRQLLHAPSIWAGMDQRASATRKERTPKKGTMGGEFVESGART